MLEGEEVSFFVVSDGKVAVPIGTAQDHKRIGNNETGPNTGGMGAYSPASIVDSNLTKQIMSKIIMPTIEGMNARGTPFKGILYAGLMLTEKGPKLIEYNVRFGDPEAQVILPRLEDDLLAIMLAAAQGSLTGEEIKFSKKTALTVVIAAKNYPGTPVTGAVINGISAAQNIKNVIVTHAGTRSHKSDIVVSGGRVLNITALASTIADAQNLAYKATSEITWEDCYYRKDIGWREIDRVKPKIEAEITVEVNSQESKSVSGRKRENSKTPKSVKRSS